jgi:Tfp pilus assembly protein PilF
MEMDRTRNEEFLLWGKVLAIVLACFCCYWPAVHGGWLWDDDTLLTQNPDIFSPTGLWNIWFKPSTPDYFPLTITGLWVQWRFFGMEPMGYHVVSIALHAAGALLLWWALGKMRVPGAWLAGLIFAVHPVCVPSVAWVAEQKNTVSMPLFLAAWGFFVMWEEARAEGGEGRGFYLRALGLFLLAMLAKSSVVMFPVAALLYIWWRRGAVGLGDVARLAPFFAVSFVLGLVTVWFQHGKAMGGEAVALGGALERLALAGMALVFYLGNVFLPSNLMAIYPRWDVDPPQWWQFLPWAGMAAAGVVFWVFRKSWGRHALMAFGFFAIMVLPVLGFVKIAYMRITWVSDHFIYLSMLGPVALAAAVVAVLWNSGSLAKRVAAGAAVFALVGGLGVTTYGYARVWSGEEALWNHNLQRNWNAWQAHSRLGALEHRRGNFEKTHLHFTEAGKLRPDLPEIKNNLGSLMMNSDRHAEALGLFEEAVRLSPRSQPLLDNLVRSLIAQGRNAEALEHARALCELYPDDATNFHNLGILLKIENQDEAARAAFRAALRINPYFSESTKMLFVLDEEKRTGKLPEDWMVPTPTKEGELPRATGS